MKKLIILVIASTMAIAMSAQTNPVSITVTSSWNKVYAWIWKCPERYCERFIPLTKVDNNTWTLTLDMDETAYIFTMTSSTCLFIRGTNQTAWRTTSPRNTTSTSWMLL